MFLEQVVTSKGIKTSFLLHEEYLKSQNKKLQALLSSIYQDASSEIEQLILKNENDQREIKTLHIKNNNLEKSLKQYKEGNKNKLITSLENDKVEL